MFKLSYNTIKPLATPIEPTASRQQVLYTAMARALDSFTYLYNSMLHMLLQLYYH